jgi:hypothetical protein
MENASRATWLLHVDYFIKLTDSGEWEEFIARNKRNFARSGVPAAGRNRA